MLITLIVLAALNLLVLGYIAWRMPKRTNVVNNFTMGGVVSADQVKKAFQRRFASGWAPGTPW